MNKSGFVDTHGDPLGAIQKIIATAWESRALDGVLVSGNGGSKPHLIDDPALLNQVNPFRPLMTRNAAKFIPQILDSNPEARLGAVLRPCELRAWEAKHKRERVQSEGLLTVCVDCLGTYPKQDYQWRAERKGSPENLTQESLQFARQGGIAAYRFRSACQACRTPVGSGADINVGVIGLPVRQKILVEVSDQVDLSVFNGNSSNLQADQGLLEQRERVVAKLLERITHTRQRLADNLDDILPRDVDALLAQFKSCGECRECFENCPICAADYPAKDEMGLYRRDQVKEWMISCAGCGMCEQACPNHLPLVTIFSHIREMLLEPQELIH